MIVCLILKADKPLLRHAVDLYRHNDRAGIDLVRFLQILKLAVLFQLLHRHQSKIHQADKLVLSALHDLLPDIQIRLIRRLDRGPVISVLKSNVL